MTILAVSGLGWSADMSAWGAPSLYAVDEGQGQGWAGDSVRGGRGIAGSEESTVDAGVIKC